MPEGWSRANLAEVAAYEKFRGVGIQLLTSAGLWRGPTAMCALCCCRQVARRYWYRSAIAAAAALARSPQWPLPCASLP